MPNTPGGQRPAVSVIIPTYQRRDSVHRLLTALAHQDLTPDRFEVILVIDGSDDGTEELAYGLTLPYALYVVAHSNRGRARTRNAGIAAARGELLVMLDDDMEPHPGCLSGHVAAHPPGVRRCVVGAAPIEPAAGASPCSVYVAWKFNEHLARLERPDHRFVVQDFYSGNISIPRELLLEVGTFEESFSAYGNEDLELGLRLRGAGVDIRYDATAAARQHHDKDFVALAADMRAAGRTAVQFAVQHPEVLEHLPIGDAREPWPGWHRMRGLLVAIGRRSPLAVRAVVALTHWLERRRLRRVVLYYRHVLELFYWMGARDALDEPWARSVRARLDV
jgi:glycosyltransferase involved in cell wall biosynthesis